MEAVRTRPQRSKAPTPLEEQENQHKPLNHHENDEETAVFATMDPINVVQRPDGIRSTEERSVVILQDGESAQEVNHYHTKPLDKHNDKEELELEETRQALVKDPVPLGHPHESTLAPSAPVFEDDASTALASQTSLPPVPTRTTRPRAFHETSIHIERDTPLPSAPLESDSGDNEAIQTTPSAPSLSPLGCKKRDRGPQSATNSPVLRQVPRTPTTVTIETASAAVRTAFATVHRDAQPALRLYPSLPPAATIREKEDDQPLPYAQLLQQTYVHVKLEPLVNYEMKVLRAEASQKRQTMKMRHVEANKGELYARIERYLFAEYLVHTAASRLQSYKKERDDVVQKVWTVAKKRVAVSKRCGDNVEMDQQMDFQTATLEPLRLERLKTQLAELRQLRSVEAAMHTFDRALAFLDVEQYLTRVLHEPHLVAHGNHMSAAGGRTHDVEGLDVVVEGTTFYEGVPPNTPLATAVDHLKYCVDVLVFFEKKVTLEEAGVFHRVPPSFARGELVWSSGPSKTPANGVGMERKVKCYACGTVNPLMKATQWCTMCTTCHVVLSIPPSSVATKSIEWFTSIGRFRKAVQKWLSTCLYRLLRLKSLQTMPYLLMHVMYLPRIATDERAWFLRFLQFPRAMIQSDGSLRNAWSEDLVDHYLAMLHLVFHPEKIRRMATLVSSGPLAGVKGTKSADAGVKETTGVVSTDWVLLENPEMLDRYYLSDDDFVAVVNQFPNTFAFGQLFHCTTDVHKGFRRALTLVLELTQSLQAFPEFEKLPTRIAHLLGQLLGDAAAFAKTETDAVSYPTLFDQLFLTSLHGVMASECNRVAWRSLTLFPYTSLSDLAKWDVLAVLLLNVSSLPLEAKSASGWRQFIATRTAQGVDVRRQLYCLIESDTESAVHLLNAVARLAASCEAHHATARPDLVAVAVHEVFIAGFTVEACQQALGASGERAAGPLSTICLAHPWILSLLITLLFQYHKCAATWIHIFETFPINRWLPTPSDLSKLQEWLLLEDTGASRSALARFLLDRINWEYDVKRERLFTDALLHRQVALMVAEALVLYKTRKERAKEGEYSVRAGSDRGALPPFEVPSIAQSLRRALWLSDTIDFEQWCWKLMLKLQFYSAKTHEPLLPLIDLRHDRSREALTLRRWFAGASVLRVVPTRKVFPFYASYEEQVGAYGAVKDVDQVKRGAGVGGSTGAPIVQESRVLLTPHKARGTDLESTVATRTEPIVAYVICQLTTFVYSDRLDRWEPLLVLLKSALFSAAVQVLEHVVPLLARCERETELRVDKVVEKEKEEDGNGSSDAPRLRHGDNAVEVCMAAMQALSTDEMGSLLHALHEFSYMNTDELYRMQDVLKKGYVGGWESTAKERILAKLRFVRECSRFVHPVVLPALLNECFPQSSPVSVTTSALFHGAMSWISSALGGEASTSALSPSAACLTSAALSIRNSSLTATTASLALIGGREYSMATTLVCAVLRRSFESAMDESILVESMQFWVRTLLQVPFWYENAAFRHVLDVILHCSMATACTSPVQPTTRAASLLYDVVALIEAAFDTFCQRLARRNDEMGCEEQFVEKEAVHVVSFLPAVASAVPFGSFFGGACDVAHYVRGCPVLAFWSLLVETRKEVPLLRAMGQVMLQCEPKTMKKVAKMKQVDGKLTAMLSAVQDDTRPRRGDVGTWSDGPFVFAHTSFESLAQYKIYRWGTYCLELPDSEPLQILYWQVFFALYFAASGSRVFGHHFLDRPAYRRAQRGPLRQHLQARLRHLVTASSTQAQVVLTATSGARGLSKEGKERQYAHYVVLSQLYTAMDAWLEETDPNEWLKEEELTQLPRHYEVERLCDVLRLSDVLLSSDSSLAWSDLPLWTRYCGFDFTASTKTREAPVDAHASLASGGDDEDFAFVEDALEVAHRQSGFGYAGAQSLTIRPLALNAEDCGPSSLTDLPTVTVRLSSDQCVVTPSMPLNKAGLKTMALKFSETLSTLVTLDAELVTTVAQLYMSKRRTVTQTVPCLEGPKCRQPAVFQFEYLEWLMDPRMEETIQSICAQSERCDFHAMLPPNAMAVHEVDFDDTRALSTSLEAQEFLQLDRDGYLLSVQLVLIDQIVRTLGVEHEKLQRTIARVEKETVTLSEQDQDKTEGHEVPGREECERQRTRLHEQGLAWFHVLTELDTNVSRLVVPLREALARSIQQLGRQFVAVDEHETCLVLDLMLQDPSRIPLLCECFYPAAAPLQFVPMFAKLMSASSALHLSSDEKLTLLERFDVQTWLQSPHASRPTRIDRETVVCLLLHDLSQHYPADQSRKAVEPSRNDTSARPQVVRVCAKQLELICSMHLADHVEKVVQALVGVVDEYHFQGTRGTPRDVTGRREEAARSTRPVDAVVWDALIGLSVATWEAVPLVHIEACVSFLSQHLTSLRWQTGFGSGPEGERSEEGGEGASRAATAYPLVEWQRLGVLKSLLDLVTLCCRVVPESKQWACIAKCFEPLLATLYQPATTTDGSAINTPWAEQDTCSTGTAICSCFVATCSAYLQPASPTLPELSCSTKLSQIWTFYLTHLVPHAPLHMCKRLHHFLTRLPWEQWCLTLEIVHEMRDLVATEHAHLTGQPTRGDHVVPPLATTLSPYPFVSWLVRDVLCRTTWQVTETWLAAQSESLCSSFLLEVASLCVDLVLEVPHFYVASRHASTHVLPPYFVNFIKHQATFWRQWKMTEHDVTRLQQMTLAAVHAPRTARPAVVESEAFALAPSTAMLQDALTRLQLVFGVVSQITTLTHAKVSLRARFERVTCFFQLLYRVLDETTRDAGADTPASWRLVLYGATCTALYEKLDEIVHVYKSASGSKDALEAQDEALTTTLVTVLNFCNLALVEPFFHQLHGNGGQGSLWTGWPWTKCGNVVSVELDALLRDFASRQKTVPSPPALTLQLRATDEREKNGQAPSPVGRIGIVIGHVVWSFLSFRGGEVACFAACGRALASVHVMSHVAEKSIETWVVDDRSARWDVLAKRLQVPELSRDEFEGACLAHGHVLTLQVLFLQHLQRAPVLTEALSLSLLSKLVQWLERVHLHGPALTQLKVLFLAAEGIRFVCTALAPVLSSPSQKRWLRQVSDVLLAYGHARRHTGIMQAIGLGGPLHYSLEFHVACLAMGIFLRLQTRTSAPLRWDARSPLKVTKTTAKHGQALAALLQSHEALAMKHRAEVILTLVRDDKRSLADHEAFLLELFATIYPTHPWLLGKCFS